MNAATQTALQNVFNKIKDTPTFHPANVNLFARHDGWTRQAGDVIRVKSDDTNYDLPITNLSLHWTGSSRDGGGETTQIAIEAAGNPEREPLPELKRKNYDTVAQIGRVRRYSAATQEQLEEDEQHYTTEFTKTNKEIGLSAKITGVKLDANGDVVWQQAKDAQGHPLYYDSDGNITTEVTDKPVWSDIPEWDNTQGATVWGDMGTSGFMSHMFNAIKDNKGNTISIGGVQTSPGAVLIEAMNSKGTGEAKINANIVSIQSTTGSGISIDANGNVSIVAKGVVDKINESDSTGQSAVIIDADHLDVSGIISAGGIVVSGDIFATEGTTQWLEFPNIRGTLVSGTTVSGTTVDAGTLKTAHLQLAYESGGETRYSEYSSHTVKMTGITAAQNFLGTTDLDLAHAHSVTLNANGTMTLGGAVAVGDASANFNIADSTWYSNLLTTIGTNINNAAISPTYSNETIEGHVIPYVNLPITVTPIAGKGQIVGTAKAPVGTPTFSPAAGANIVNSGGVSSLSVSVSLGGITIGSASYSGTYTEGDGHTYVSAGPITPINGGGVVYVGAVPPNGTTYYIRGQVVYPAINGHTDCRRGLTYKAHAELFDKNKNSMGDGYWYFSTTAASEHTYYEQGSGVYAIGSSSITISGTAQMYYAGTQRNDLYVRTS